MIPAANNVSSWSMLKTRMSRSFPLEKMLSFKFAFVFELKISPRSDTKKSMEELGSMDAKDYSFKGMLSFTSVFASVFELQISQLTLIKELNEKHGCRGVLPWRGC